MLQPAQSLGDGLHHHLVFAVVFAWARAGGHRKPETLVSKEIGFDVVLIVSVVSLSILQGAGICRSDFSDA